MEDMLKDKRFAHIAKDPKFRRIPKSERKVKIDKRFQSMFKDKKFSVKYTVDKRGRPTNQTSAENLRKYYDISSSEEDSSSEESDTNTKEEKVENEKSKIKKAVVQIEKSKKKKDIVKNEKCDTKKDIVKNGKSKTKKEIVQNGKTQKNKIKESEDNDNKNKLSKSKKLHLAKKSIQEVSEEDSEVTEKEDSEEDSEDSEENSDEESDEASVDDDSKENEMQLNIRKKNEQKVDDKVKKKLHDLSVDYARGEGILLSDSSSEEEISEYEEDEEEEFNWDALDKDAEEGEVTHRLAACHLNWDRIRAVDLMFFLNRFLPTGGVIKSVKIYPSEFGMQRMKEEEVKGPTELVESKKKTDDNEDFKFDDEDEEVSYMKNLRQYEINRLKYYYAVIEFDSAKTAETVYMEIDNYEYESSANKIDLRFIADDITFDQEPKEVCDKLPAKYEPRMFITSALQHCKVDLTWDETNPERQEITQKLFSGKLDDIDKNDIQAYLASGTSGDESEDEVKKHLEGIDDSEPDKNPIDKYKSLLKSIEQIEEEKKNKEVELEFTWGIGAKEKTEKLVKEKMKQKEELTPFEQYIEKRKAKKKAKREQKKTQKKEGDHQSDNEDSVPSDIDMNDPYFAEELKNTQPKGKKRKNTSKNSDLDSADEQEEKRQAELELLLMDENEENKRHFSMKRIEEAESLTKSKKKRLSKKKRDIKEEATKDDFTVNVEDPRFNALFTSHHFNIDPADPHYRKTKGTEALINEKLKRRNKNDTDNDILQKSVSSEKNKDSKVNAEMSSVIKSIKRNTKNLNKRI